MANALPGLQRRAVVRGTPDALHRDTDDIADEVAVALQFNGISHATVLATPTDLEDLAIGFAFTEGIIHNAGEIYGIDVDTRPEGIVLQVEIASARMHGLKLRRRTLAGRTGCGLCGLESLDDVQRDLAVLPAPTQGYRGAALTGAAIQLDTLQPLHRTCGATHAAGWADMNGCVTAVREDVGRHNALDKLIGHLLRQGVATTEGFAVISSRASFEMVQKAAAAGIGALVAVSAPTRYAVDMAERLNILLAGFVRGGNFTLYSHDEYLKNEPGHESPGHESPGHESPGRESPGREP
ncbi:formate dehydrogenase accessory sulfurtransferase FdhD [Pusillimonas sp. TS35]|nr:formate dehydrogenase accessory sulfurtransferase FdhD [Pusillimonas sp. TS35]